MFPSQANGSGLGDEADLASPVFYLPLLGVVVELYGGSSSYLQPAEFVKWHSFRPETVSRTVRVENNCKCIHKLGLG